MSSRIPRQSAESGLTPPDNDAGLGAELSAVVAGARRRALRDGDRQIDTAHLLHSLLESDAEVRGLFDEEGRLARLLGYLVQRSIGYGLRWQGTVEDSGAVAVAADPGWSPAAAGAMERARRDADVRGGGPARGLDLFAQLVADPRSRAVEVLAHAGVGVPGAPGRARAESSR
ncbi:Clp protease N-terminal domain-containing protein [Streptomyces sp. NPDC048566]|uniref:Clp protease N-terminal domain-containing protein n=1 Tax=Streptomyces sp. NPDC048566 TaxID=3365569 RepID=UPI0037152B88